MMALNVRFLARVIVAALFVVFLSDAAVAANATRASMDLAPSAAKLIVKRDNEIVRLTDGHVALEFTDPRERGEIEKILLDPSYRPGTSEYADFFVETKIVAPRSKKSASETALCSWNEAKSTATCEIPDDGGRFQIIALSRGDALTTSRFMLRIVRLAGYRGFRLAAEEETAAGVGVPIVIELRGKSSVDVAIKF